MAQVPHFKHVVVEVLMCASDECTAEWQIEGLGDIHFTNLVHGGLQTRSKREIDIRESIRSRYQRYRKDSKT